MSGYSITMKTKGFKARPYFGEHYPTIEDALARAATLQSAAKRNNTFGICRWEKAVTAAGMSYLKMVPETL